MLMMMDNVLFQESGSGSTSTMNEEDEYEQEDIAFENLSPGQLARLRILMGEEYMGMNSTRTSKKVIKRRRRRTRHRGYNQVSPLYLGKAVMGDSFDTDNGKVNNEGVEEESYRLNPYNHKAFLRRKQKRIYRRMKRLKGTLVQKPTVIYSTAYRKLTYPLNGNGDLHFQKENSQMQSLTDSEILSSSSSDCCSGGEARLIENPSDITGFSSDTLSRGNSGYGIQNDINSLGKIESSKEIKNGEHNTRLTQKYHPKSFRDLVGQKLVCQTLSASIARDQIAPFYLFHGPRGTGKTSAARIFGMALNCTSEGAKPCGECNSCSNEFNITEVDLTRSYVGTQSIKVLLQTVRFSWSPSHYKVYVMEECHALSHESWSILLNGMEEEGHTSTTTVVFVMITTDLTSLPKIALSRCQKFCFTKLKNSHIYSRLREIASSESIDIEEDALHLIAEKAGGSMRDAQINLEQLALVGNTITISSVSELVGLIPDNILISLLFLALSGNAVETVKYIRENNEHGIEPLVLITQLAALITDILAGSHISPSWIEVENRLASQDVSTEVLQERLCLALKILWEAERQLRFSNGDTTWLIAALLQLAPHAHSYSDPGLQTNTTPNYKPLLDRNNNEKDILLQEEKPGVSNNASELNNGENDFEVVPLQSSHDLWKEVVEKVQPEGVKRLLQGRGQMVRALMSPESAVVHLEFQSNQDKEMFELLEGNLSDAFRKVLPYPVQLKMGVQTPSSSDEDENAGIAKHQLFKTTSSLSRKPRPRRRRKRATGNVNRRPLSMIATNNLDEEKENFSILDPKQSQSFNGRRQLDSIASSSSTSSNKDLLTKYLHELRQRQGSSVSSTWAAQRNSENAMLGTEIAQSHCSNSTSVDKTQNSLSHHKSSKETFSSIDRTHKSLRHLKSSKESLQNLQLKEQIIPSNPEDSKASSGLQSAPPKLQKQRSRFAGICCDDDATTPDNRNTKTSAQVAQVEKGKEKIKGKKKKSKLLSRFAPCTLSSVSVSSSISSTKKAA